MKTQSEIEKSIAQYFFAWQDKVTSYAKISVVRGIIVAVSAMIADAWNEITQIKRRIFPQTATGADLDTLLGTIGIARRGAVQVSTICVFTTSHIEKGTSSSVATSTLSDTAKEWTVNQFTGWKLKDSAGNYFRVVSNTATALTVVGNPASGAYSIYPVVPAGTAILSNVTGERYTTATEVIVGAQNPVLEGQQSSISLGNSTIVTAQTAGSQAAAGANELTTLAQAISGIDTVTNPIPTQPRSAVDAESDDQYRYRASLYFATLDNSTQSYFESVAIRGNAKVVRAIVHYSPDIAKTVIEVATRSGEALSSPELTALKTYIADRSKAFDEIEVKNMAMVDIAVTFSAYIYSPDTLQAYYTAVADKLADYLDFSNWDSSKAVTDDDVFLNAKAANPDIDIDLSTLYVEGLISGVHYQSKKITFTNTLPRLARLKITNVVNGQSLDYTISIYPINKNKNAFLNPYSDIAI